MPNEATQAIPRPLGPRVNGSLQSTESSSTSKSSARERAHRSLGGFGITIPSRSHTRSNSQHKPTLLPFSSDPRPQSPSRPTLVSTLPPLTFGHILICKFTSPSSLMFFREAIWVETSEMIMVPKSKSSNAIASSLDSLTDSHRHSDALSSPDSCLSPYRYLFLS